MRRIYLALFLSLSLIGTAQTTAKKKTVATTKTTATSKPKTITTATKTTEVAKTSSQSTSRPTSTKARSNSNYPLGIGKVQLNAGAGASTWGFPVYAGIDVGLTKDISLGFETSYRVHDYGRYSNYYYYNVNQKTTVLGFMANGNYHFNKLLKLQKKFDVYAGVSAGYLLRIDDNKTELYNGVYYNYTSPYASGVSANVQAGARYFLNENFAIHSQIEAGNLNQAFKAGITYKF